MMNPLETKNDWNADILFRRDRTGFGKRLLRFSIVTLLILLAIELFVFNFRSFRLAFGSYEQKSFSMEVTARMR